MRLVIARCSVDYEGRLSAHLPSAVRLLMVKADGCVAIHADGGAYKPLNWMNAPNRLAEHDDRWIVTNSKGETLTIVIEVLIAETAHEMGVDPGLRKDGVEAHLQELLAANPTPSPMGSSSCGASTRPTSARSTCCAATPQGRAVAVEVKRRGEIDGVEQLTRYLERMDRDPKLRGGARHLRGPGHQAAGQGARRVDARSIASRSTTTSCAASSRTSSGCSSSFPERGRSARLSDEGIERNCEDRSVRQV
jgi:RecB family endonuclease NucS